MTIWNARKLKPGQLLVMSAKAKRMNLGNGKSWRGYFVRAANTPTSEKNKIWVRRHGGKLLKGYDLWHPKFWEVLSE